METYLEHAASIHMDGDDYGIRCEIFADIMSQITSHEGLTIHETLNGAVSDAQILRAFTSALKLGSESLITLIGSMLGYATIMHNLRAILLVLFARGFCPERIVSALLGMSVASRAHYALANGAITFQPDSTARNSEIIEAAINELAQIRMPALAREAFVEVFENEVRV